MCALLGLLVCWCARVQARISFICFLDTALFRPSLRLGHWILWQSLTLDLRNGSGVVALIVFASLMHCWCCYPRCLSLFAVMKSSERKLWINRLVFSAGTLGLWGPQSEENKVQKVERPPAKDRSVFSIGIVCHYASRLNLSPLKFALELSLHQHSVGFMISLSKQFWKMKYFGPFWATVLSCLKKFCFLVM